MNVRLVRWAALTASAVLLVSAASATARADADKVTGGGQVIASADSLGPGDTLGFVATDDGGRTSGELQVTQTTKAGEEMPIFHGIVTCLEVSSDSTARFGGKVRFDSTGDTRNFVVDVQDNGEDGNDTIEFRRTENEPPCDDDESGTDLTSTRLARGNLTVHNAS